MRILRGNGHHRAPVAAARDQTARPTTKVILLIPDAIEYGTRPHDQQTSQVAVSGFGDVAQSSFAAAAVLAGREPDPGGDPYGHC